MKYSNIFGIIVGSMLFASCNEPTNQEVFANEVFAAKLEYPIDVIPCSDIAMNDILLTRNGIVNFRWEEVNDQVDFYNLFLTNNDTFETVIFKTSENNFDVEVATNTSYSWYVNTFFENNPLNKTSLVSNFMIESSSFSVHVPNAAMPSAPQRGKTIDSNVVDLVWECTDRDGDIIHYEVILDTKYPPTEVIGTTDNDQFTFSVNGNSIYYWMINTEDSQGNITSSEIFQFRTLGVL